MRRSVPILLTLAATCTPGCVSDPLRLTSARPDAPALVMGDPAGYAAFARNGYVMLDDEAGKPLARVTASTTP